MLRNLTNFLNLAFYERRYGPILPGKDQSVVGLLKWRNWLIGLMFLTLIHHHKRVKNRKMIE
jgi:hypothetical protein